MSNSNRHFDSFQEHTLLKHAVLYAYVRAWAMKLLMWGVAGRTIYFVDAFAGEGRDENGNAGSPLIACMIAGQVRGFFMERGIEVELRVIAIEKGRDRHKALCEVLRPFGPDGQQCVTVYRGVLADHINEIERAIGSAPTLYFLDPFGVSGLDASMYRRMLTGGHNEIFALFADVGATRLHGLVIAENGDVDRQLARLEARPTLFPEIDAHERAGVERKIAQRDQAIDATREASEEHLTRALGSVDWLKALEGVASEDRPDAFLRLFVTQMVRSGARRVITLPMRNTDGRRVYSLVHASRSAKGYVAMKEAIHQGLRAGDTLPEEVCQRIREDLSVPIAPFADFVAAEYAEREMSWSDVGKASGLKSLLLENTSIFPFQMDDLKAEFKRRGYQLPGRAIVYSFPRPGEEPPPRSVAVARKRKRVPTRAAEN